MQEDEFLRQKIHGAQFAVTCTGFNRKHMAGVAGQDAPVYRCYHGINIEKFTRSAALSRNGKPPVILSIGRFVPKKGFPTLLKAMHLLKEKGYAFSAYFAGGGPMETELQTLIDQFDLTANVQLINKLSQEELLEYYRKADIFALACEVQPDGDRDGIPNVLVEAMALEIPSVSTAISGIPELIDDGKNGLLVPQRNPEALAAALEKLITQPELALVLGKAGRETVKQEFDNRQNVIKIGKLLDDAMKSPALENRDFRAIVKYS
ncbi:MAG: glycosyltransferase family 4 protein [Calditrichia bacterium]